MAERMTPQERSAERADAEQRFDVVVRGGEVRALDGSPHGIRDVGIVGDRIAAIDRGLPVADGTAVVDARGAIVVPGLVDFHTHCYWGATYFGAHPDAVATRSGVTTWVDAGSAGAWTFNGLRALADRCRVTMKAWINIAAGGMTAMEGELDKLDHCDVGALAAVVEENRDFVVGVKIRLGHARNGVAALDRALEAAERTGLPLMAHIGTGDPPIGEIVARLRPGDILTHVYVAKQHCVVGADGKLVAGMLEAKARGVQFDVAHGRTAFSWRVAEQAIAQGLAPDFVSTDLHLRNIDIPHIELPSLMSKFLHLGFSLDEVLAMTTTRPLERLDLGPDLGVLRPGARADVAVLRLVDGPVGLNDADGQTRTVERLLRHERTILRGRVLEPTRSEPPPYLRAPGAARPTATACC